MSSIQSRKVLLFINKGFAPYSPLMGTFCSSSHAFLMATITGMCHTSIKRINFVFKFFKYLSFPRSWKYNFVSYSLRLHDVNQACSRAILCLTQAISIDHSTNKRQSRVVCVSKRDIFPDIPMEHFPTVEIRKSITKEWWLKFFNTHLRLAIPFDRTPNPGFPPEGPRPAFIGPPSNHQGTTFYMYIVARKKF